MTWVTRTFELSDQGVLNLAWLVLDLIKSGTLDYDKNVITIHQCIAMLDEDWGVTYP